MEKIIKQILATMAISTLLVTNSVANDDVIVNLSVLDSLNNNTIIAKPSIQKPLFPIVKKQSKIKKQTNKQNRVQKKQSPKAEKKASTEVKKQLPQIPFVESNEEIVVVDVEPAPQPKHAEINNDTIQAEATINQTTESKAEQPKDEQSLAIQDKTDETVLPKEQENTSPALLLDEKNIDKLKTSSSLLSFETEEDELSTELQKQIDEIISQFENPSQNKIAIYAYNFDDGVDTFKKKRISLNRAVAVRSYLLPKGYKNFSIKVININEKYDKINKVELEELKN